MVAHPLCHRHAAHELNLEQREASADHLQVNCLYLEGAAGARVQAAERAVVRQGQQPRRQPYPADPPGAVGKAVSGADNALNSITYCFANLQFPAQRFAIVLQ